MAPAREPAREAGAAPKSPLGAAQRAVESAIIAIVTSTGLYLVGSVYTESFYGRMSIDATTLDLSPPFIALQSFHVINSLLEYPAALLLFYLLYRWVFAHRQWWRTWYDVVHQRFGRLVLLLLNTLVVLPLVAAAFRAGNDLGTVYSSSVLSDVSQLMERAGLAMVVYVIWLSFGPRALIFTQIRERKLVPIILLATLYFLDALVATSHGAAFDAQRLMTGAADSAIEVEFTLADDATSTLPEDVSLILVTARGGNFYVVERQPNPPSTRPAAYIVPFGVVDSARLQRINEADQEEDPGIYLIIGEGTPEVSWGE